jgi:hypothetical protein
MENKGFYMNLQFERKFMSEAQFMDFDENFKCFDDEIGPQVLRNPVIYYEDTSNKILFFSGNWIISSAERRDEPALVVFVQCKEGYFRFNYQEFYHQTQPRMICHNSFEQIFKQVKPVSIHQTSWTIWTIFKIEVIEFKMEVNIYEKIEFYIQQILSSHLRQARTKKDDIQRAYKTKIIYVNQYFRTKPEYLIK